MTSCLLRQQHIFWYTTLQKIYSHFIKFRYIQRVHSWEFFTLTINLSEVWPRQIFQYIFLFTVRLKSVLNTSWRCLEDVLTTTVWLGDASWKRLKDILKKSFQGVLKTFWRRLAKTSWRCLEGVFSRRLENILKASWKRL